MYKILFYHRCTDAIYYEIKNTYIENFIFWISSFNINPQGFGKTRRLTLD